MVLYILVAVALYFIPVYVHFLSRFNWNLYNKVTRYGDTRNLIYDSKKYVITDLGTFSPDYEELSEIGWSWFIPPLGKFIYFSDSIESPTFIYCPRGNNVWVREDYNYDQEVFTIDGTNIEYIYSDVFDRNSIEHFDVLAKDVFSFTWHPKNNEKLYGYAYIYEKDGLYYLKISNNGNGYLINDDFLELLRANNVL